MVSKRAPIPEAVKRQVLMEAGYRCAVPTCRNIIALDIHHMVEVSKGGGNEPANLLVLCPLCHALYTRGEITEDAIRTWKGMLVALNHAFDNDSIDNLLFLYKTEHEPLMLSGDGVLQFTHVVAAGLATYRSSVYYGPIEPDPFLYSLYASTSGPPSPKPVPRIVYTVTLTRKGHLLVEAWMNGDAAALQRALAAPSDDDVAEDDVGTTPVQTATEDPG